MEKLKKLLFFILILFTLGYSSEINNTSIKKQEDIKK